jgi:hypothetical protein
MAGHWDNTPERKFPGLSTAEVRAVAIHPFITLAYLGLGDQGHKPWLNATGDRPAEARNALYDAMPTTNRQHVGGSWAASRQYTGRSPRLR